MSVTSDSTQNSEARTLFTSSITSSILANGLPGNFLETRSFTSASDQSSQWDQPSFTHTSPPGSGRPLLVDVPRFVQEDPNDPYSSIITIIAQSIEAHRIDTLFAQALIGLITTLRSSESQLAGREETFASHSR
ncbi:hypothetical protein AB1N83_014468 [Pleurotus pulmonarius]